MPRTRRLSPRWLLLLAILPAISLALHFHGLMVLGWDSEPPLRPLQYLMQSLSAWKWDAYLGQPNVFQITQAPLALVYVVLTGPFGIVLAEKIVLTAIFVLPAFTMYYAARRIFPNDRYLPLAGAWCYALCPLLFVRFYVPIVTVQLVYALLPLAVNAWVDLFRRGARPVNMLWVAGVELAFLPCANNLAYWLVPHLVAVAMGGLLHCSRRHRPRRIGAFWLAILTVVLVNGFWLAPQMLFGLLSGPTFEHESINSAYTVGVKKDVAEGAGLSYTLRMSSGAQTGAGDRYGPYVTYARALENGLVAAPYFVWILLAAAALAMRPRDRRVVILGVLLAFGLYVMKGESPPLAFGLDWFYRIPLLGTIFRNGYDKLLPMAGFAFALLLPIAAETIGRTVRRPKVARWALAALVLLMAFPYWTGQMFMARAKGPNLASIPPPSAFAFARRLDRLRARVLFVPVSDNPQLLATTWHFFGPNVYGSMTDANFVAMSASIMNGPGSDRMMTALQEAVARRDVATFTHLARAMGVGYVFVAHDMNVGYYGGETAPDADAFLARVPGARVTYAIGPYTLWRLPGVAEIARGLVRQPIAGYDTSFARADALEPQCGAQHFALIALLDGSCNIRRSPQAPNSLEPLPVQPVRLRVAGNALLAERVAGGETSRTRLSLGAGVGFVAIDGHAVGQVARLISLAPCARVRVRGFTVGAFGPTMQPPAPVGIDGAADIALPELTAGLHVVRLRVSRTGTAAGAAIVDAVTGERVSASEHLVYPQTAMLLYALPGRSYALDLGKAENFGIARTYLRGLQVADAREDAGRILTAPPLGKGRCGPVPVRAAYTVADRLVRAGVAVRGGDLLVRVYDPLHPGRVVRAPLPPGTTLAEVGDDVVGVTAHDETLPTGAALAVMGYRAGGPARRIPIDRVGTSSNASVTNLDRAAGSAALRANGASEWMHFQAPLACPGICRLDLRLGTLVGRFGLAVASPADGGVAVAFKGARSPARSLVLHGFAPGSASVYVASSPLETPSPASGVSPQPAPPSALQVAALTLTPLQPTGRSAVTLPRVERAETTDPGAILVDRTPALVPPLVAGALNPARAPTALVLDTQFDPLWMTLVFPSGSHRIYFPAHVMADGYKNAWIVPAGLSGTVVNFYLSNVVASIGLAIALATLLVLLVKTARRARRS